MTDIYDISQQNHLSGHLSKTLFNHLVKYLAVDVLGSLNRIEYALITDVHHHYKSIQEMPLATAEALFDMSVKYGFWDKQLLENEDFINAA